MTRLPAALLLALALTACNENMVQQPRYDAFEHSDLFADGQAMQHPPEGTMDLSRPAEQAASATEPPITRALLLRGKERYAIFCSMCHGEDGRGDGVVPSRGFPHPPSLLEADQVAATDRHIFDVITNGYGTMYAHGDRIAPHDRWAIAAWVRVLQKAQEGAGDGG